MMMDLSLEVFCVGNCVGMGSPVCAAIGARSLFLDFSLAWMGGWSNMEYPLAKEQFGASSLWLPMADAPDVDADALVFFLVVSQPCSAPHSDGVQPYSGDSLLLLG